MKVYLDTNILSFLLREEPDSINRDVSAMIMDYSHLLCTSTVCAHELIHLVQIGKLSVGRKGREESPTAIEEWLERLDVEVVPVGIRHLKQLASLTIQGDHRDPNDRLIIAQAIADRVPLISSDRKFSRYRGHGLNFVFNER